MNKKKSDEEVYNEKEKFSIRTFGCQMNVYDSDRISEILSENGYEKSDNAENADVLVINTCSVREKPRNRVISVIENVRSKNPGVKVVVTGCVAQLEGESLFENGADFVVGPDWYESIPVLLSGAGNSGSQASMLEQGDENFLTARGPSAGVSAFVPIQKGCDNFCAYCVVPAARGPERSRSEHDILREVHHFIECGAREIYLLGQNVNSWKGNGGFAALLKKICLIPELKRLRFTTSHPADISDELIDAFGSIPQLMPWFHLPMQSGSNRILDLMGRKYDLEHYFSMVKKLRDSRSDIVFTTDIIVGFPGETEEDFIQTVDAVEKVGFEGMFSFMYSVRPDTRAEKMPDHISHEIKAERLKRLQNSFEETLPERLGKYTGTVQEVLVEGESLRDSSAAKGRIPHNHVVNFTLSKPVNSLIGKIVNVKINEVRTHTLYGEMI
ncbi:MAG: tRNA (N6-isopentenyl adenosine(37)-C2)-methylthiotransferase MiaB [Deltaproteobacteria bacterium]|nr:tRNA (N6-isopentenyl adenosine(37)-C2)-methylthiotransferase MiaB [Deltaproteobacteria bacterium]